MPEKFVPLHVHSDHSILDATAKIDAMVAKAKEFGFPALALTDHGNMSGAVHLWDSCRKAGIKPIVGCELYVAPGDHRDKHVPRGARRYHHLVALAANETGYRNLIKLVSLGFLEGLYGGKPRVSMDLLAGHSEGILASTACIAGLVPQALLGEEDPDAAVKAGRAALDRLLEIFGDRFYLELQDHGIPEQRRINPLLVRLSKESGVPLIFTNDSHFVGDEDFEPHRWFLAIQAGRGQTVATKEYVYTPGHKFRSGAEMRALAKAYPKELRPALLEAVERTVEVADRVDFSFQTGTYFLPQVETGGVSTAEFFRRECLAGLERRRPRLRPDRGLEYFRRLCYEMSVVHEMGFEGYFLIVADLIRWAKSHGVPCGPGRGSAAGSLAAYCLGITEIDPLRFDLLFERFLNPERVSMPDVDMDFSKEGRQRVIEYTVERYGRENVAQIVAFGTLAAKAALKDMARAAGLSVADAVKLAGVVPPALDATLPSTLRDKPDECAKLLANPEFAKVWEIATKLEGTTRNLTVHAAGVVIAPEPVDRYVPLYVQGRKGEALVTTQFDKKDVEKVGLVKMDYLGIKTLDQIEECRRLVGGEPVDLDALPVDDRATMDLFAAGDTKGIFQFESEGMRAALRRLRPERFEHLVAMNALFRPGPIQSGMFDSFIKRKNGDEPVEALHAEVADLLADTYGVVVYQEQVMRVFQTLGGLSLGEADILRKAIGKKDAELMRKELDKFVAGGKELGHDEAELVAIAETIRKFAGYGFNKSHAVAYAFLAWQTAWLKAHHPVEFMTALLTTEAKDGKPDKVQEYIGDAKKMGIRIFPPDVNYSEPYFSIERDPATGAAAGIRFGLVGIRNVGEDVVDLVVAERAKRPFGSYPDFLWRIKPNAKVAESFVFAGATGSLGGHPAQHWATTEKILCGSRRAAMAPGQVSLLSTGDLDDVLARDLEEAEPWDETALAANEHEVLGLWLEHHPLNPYRDRVKDEIAALRGAVREGGGRRRCEVLCCVTGVEYREIRNGRRAGQRFAVVGVEDLSGSAKFVMFGPEALDAAFHALIPGTIVVAKGNVSLKNDEATFYVSSLERLLDERIEEPEADSGAEDGDAWDESAETLAS